MCHTRKLPATLGAQPLMGWIGLHMYDLHAITLHPSHRDSSSSSYQVAATGEDRGELMSMRGHGIGGMAHGKGSPELQWIEAMTQAPQHGLASRESPVAWATSVGQHQHTSRPGTQSCGRVATKLLTPTWQPLRSTPSKARCWPDMWRSILLTPERNLVGELRRSRWPPHGNHCTPHLQRHGVSQPCGEGGHWIVVDFFLGRSIIGATKRPNDVPQGNFQLPPWRTAPYGLDWAAHVWPPRHNKVSLQTTQKEDSGSTNLLNEMSSGCSAYWTTDVLVYGIA